MAGLRFARTEGAFSAQDRERAGLLAKRLGLTVELADQTLRGSDVCRARRFVAYVPAARDLRLRILPGTALPWEMLQGK